MTPIYKILFRPRAEKAFNRLSFANRQQLARKLDERRRNPRVPADSVREIKDGYRIKLRSAGLRLIYQVRDNELVILVLAVAGREREEAYAEALREYRNLDQ